MGPSHKSITKPQHQLCFNQFSSNHPQIRHHNVFFLYTCMQLHSQQWHEQGRWGSDATRCLITADKSAWAQRMLSHRQPKHRHCSSMSPLGTGVWYKQPTPSITQGGAPATEKTPQVLCKCWSFPKGQTATLYKGRQRPCGNYRTFVCLFSWP